eukprot:440594-Rhodomonas_salina.1
MKHVAVALSTGTSVLPLACFNHPVWRQLRHACARGTGGTGRRRALKKSNRIQRPCSMTSATLHAACSARAQRREGEQVDGVWISVPGRGSRLRGLGPRSAQISL